MQSGLRLSCLGGHRLEVDGRPVDFSALRPRARALLRRLSMTAGQDVHREVIVEALWPGVEAASSTHRLQVAVSSVRGSVGAGRIARHHRPAQGGRRLPADPAAGVVRRRARAGSRRCTRRGPPPRRDPAARAVLLRAAVDLYAGDLLPEDGPAEWVVDERDRLRRQVATAAAELARAARRLGDAELGAGVGQALARARPLPGPHLGPDRVDPRGGGGRHGGGACPRGARGVSCSTSALRPVRGLRRLPARWGPSSTSTSCGMWAGLSAATSRSRRRTSTAPTSGTRSRTSRCASGSPGIR